jgi:hypothetical protein
LYVSARRHSNASLLSGSSQARTPTRYFAQEYPIHTSPDFAYLADLPIDRHRRPLQVVIDSPS